MRYPPVPKGHRFCLKNKKALAFMQVPNSNTIGVTMPI